MRTPLFLDEPLKFEKTSATEARLSENPDDWSAEIMNELFKQAPFVSQFEPDIDMTEVDAEKGYGLGQVILSSKITMHPQERSGPQGGISEDEEGVRQIRIPIIIRESKMAPLDLFLQGKSVFPLTEERVRAALFRPQMFDAAKSGPGDQSMLGQLYPPHRQNYGFGARGQVLSSGVDKTSAAKYPLLQKIASTISADDKERVEEALNKDASLRVALMGNPATRDYFATWLSAPEPQSADSYMKVASVVNAPDVVQIRKIPGAFLIKVARHDGYEPKTMEVDRPTAIKIASMALVERAELGNTVTRTVGSDYRGESEPLLTKVAESFGHYRVQAQGSNKQLTGVVFTKVANFDGQELPYSLFVGDSKVAGPWSIQEKIAAAPSSEPVNLPFTAITGHGTLVKFSASNSFSLMPMTVLASYTNPEGQSQYSVRSDFGDLIDLVPTKGIHGVTKIAHNRYAIPHGMSWVSLAQSSSKLVSDPQYFAKEASAKSWAAGNAVRIMTDGNLYSFKGRGLDKLAQKDRDFLGYDDAVFMSCLLGLREDQAKEKLAEAKRNKDVVIHVNRTITPWTEKVAAVKQEVTARLRDLPFLKMNLLKEAATLDDPLTVDKVLSIGFINPENVSSFVDYLPDMEDTLSRLGELLVASRLGMTEVDGGALEKAIKHLDKVLGGLRKLVYYKQEKPS